MAGILLAIVLAFSWHTALAQSAEQPMTRCWDIRDSFSLLGGIASDNTSVYAVDGNERVVALDRVTGVVNWRAELGGQTVSRIRENASALFVATEESSTAETFSPIARVRSLSKSTGITQWEYRLPKSSEYAVEVSNELVVVRSVEYLVALDAERGTIRWRRDGLAISDSALDFESGIVAISSKGKSVELISLPDGRTVKRFVLDRVPARFAVGRRQTLFTADQRGRLFSIETNGSKPVWKYKTGGAISHIWLLEGGIAATSADNFIYSISADSGNVRWKRRMPGRVSSVSMLGTARIGVTIIGETTAVVLDAITGKATGQLGLGDDSDNSIGDLTGDAEFVGVLKGNGIFGFSAKCGDEKSGV